ncbi:hypothetical protein NDU88_002528 [Pleurodeles waltl]|uniref:Reverse transcriptase domain-containing protein n=1 Tax=Pleurodeles waltl TaxID=8319 RepID=A0AAV7SEG6_PLEWA|nr:hypothetical protein NDU88_002528 [Pleurodeles waltl]
MQTWSNENNVLSDLQFRFRSGLGTVEECLNLSLLINKYTITKEDKMYAAFMDMSLAFNSINRLKLWAIMAEQRVEPSIINFSREFRLDVKASVRPAIVDYWYAISYLHYGTIGVLVVVIVGLAVSLVTGGAKQNIDRKYLHCTEDFSFDIFAFFRRDKKDKTEDLDLSPNSDDKEQSGRDNAAFQHDKIQFAENEKSDNVHGDIQNHDHVIPPFSENLWDKVS